jgi:hypothetical protein
MGTQPAQ